MSRAVRKLTVVVLAVLADMHAAWAFGSPVPAPNRRELADLVAGTAEMPGTAECLAVSGLLGAAAVVVAGPRWLPARMRQIGAGGVATVLAARAMLGATGRTGSVVPWTPSERFRRLDRNYYAPLCAMLALGSLLATRRG